MESYRFQEMLTIHQVAEVLKVKDSDTALRWLSLKGVPTHQGLKGPRVYAFSLAFALDLDLAKIIRAQLPKTWKHIYSLAACNPIIRDCVLTEMDTDLLNRSSTQTMQAKDIDEQKLLDKILGK